MVRLVDAPGGAVAHPIEGAAPGAVDAGQAEDVHRHAVAAPEFEPRRLRRHPSPPPFRGGRQGRVLVDPGAAGVAVDPGGRQVSGPDQPPGDVACMALQRRVPVGAGRNRAQQVAGAGQRRVGVGQGKEEGVDAGGGQAAPRFLALAGAGDAPAGGHQPPGEDGGTVAQPETEETWHFVSRGSPIPFIYSHASPMPRKEGTADPCAD